jgi:hypothetical protein
VVPRDDLHARVLCQPVSQRFSSAVGQQIHRAAALQVDEEGAVALAATEGPVIHAQDLGCASPARHRLADPPQERIGTALHPQRRHQARSRLTTQGVADQEQCLVKALGPPRRGADDPRQPLGEDAAGAVRSVAEELAARQLKPDRQAMPGQVGQVTVITTVDPTRSLAAGRTNRIRTRRLDHERDHINGGGDVLQAEPLGVGKQG